VKTFLLMSHSQDAVSQRVAQGLGLRGHRIILTSNAVAAPFLLSWRLQSDPGDDTWVWREASSAAAPTIAGVLVRSAGGPSDPENWDPHDLFYAQVEAQAALLAWIWSLPCLVVNRCSADLWFRPQRSYPEWQALFAECGLPRVSLLVTDEIDAARDFGVQSRGHVAYVPLTSSNRYPITSPTDWLELAKLLDHVPVCLMAIPRQASMYATIVGRQVVWDQDVPADARALDGGLLTLAERLGVDLMQVDIVATHEGFRCINVDIYPVLHRHDSATQETVVDALIDLLEGGRPAVGPLRPPEVRAFVGQAAERGR